MISELTLNYLDRQILNRIQSDFPISQTPYVDLASDLDTSAEEIHRSVCNLRDEGIIRRIGASYVPGLLGYSTTLVAAEVTPEFIETAAACASSFKEVTHNYERDDRLNLWFTVISPGKQKLQTILSAVGESKGVRSIHSLPSLGTFKLKVEFNFEDSTLYTNAAATAGIKSPPAQTVKLALDKPLIRRTCGDIDNSLDPFGNLASGLGISCQKLIEYLKNYRERGIMRRFGAVLRHQKAGFTGNGMTVWNVPEKKLKAAGLHMASKKEISHCYHRAPLKKWPFNLYAMMHGQNRNEVENMCRVVSEETGISDYRILFSTREFKKTSMVFFQD